jgi:hypothetical protein
MIEVDKIENIELPDFEYTPQGIEELKAVLKAGKVVRNPFAKYYNTEVEVLVVQETDVEYK